MPADLPVGTVTFLFTDIEGSTRLLAQLGAEMYAEVLAEHRRVLREAFSAEGGVEVDTQGDALFVAFPTAAGAVAAAAVGQQALGPGPVRVRMGLHTGAPTVTAGGYVGIDVHRGARVAALAHGGQVIVSAATAALVEGQPLRDLGRHRLKDFDAPAQLFQLGAAEFPPLRTPGAVDLPVPTSPFLGREDELFEAAATWLDHDPRVLTIVGPGGVGKTRFSIELARFLAEEAEGGTLFVPLAPVRAAELMTPLIAERLGAPGNDAAAIATRIGEKRVHLVLDNLEQLLPEAALALAELLAAIPVLRIVATSREPLRIAGESEFELPSMDERDAVSLFVGRAQAVRPDVVESRAVHELVRRLDGLPLAIELAAARVKLLSPQSLLERISQRLDLLKGGRDAPERHATLRATIAWSYDLLDREEQSLFARLAVFRGGFKVDTAEAVCDANLETVASLLDKSLIRRRTDPNGEERLWMLETIQDFALERLQESGEENALRGRQSDWLIALAEAAGTRILVDVPQAWNFDLVTPEIDNVRAVLEWEAEHNPARGLRLATWLEAFWVVRDPVEGAGWLERLLERSPTAEPELRAGALRALGGALAIFGEAERAGPCHQQSLDLFVAAGEHLQAADMRVRVAANMMIMGDQAAWALLEDTLRESRELGLRLVEIQALGFLVYKAQAEGDLAAALDLALRSAALAREVGWPWWEAGQLHIASTLEHGRGQLDAAEGHALDSLALSSALGDRRHTIFAASQLASIAAERGDAARAGRLWGAIEHEEDVGPVGQWEQHREQIERLVLRAEGPIFANARAEGRLLSIAEAAGQGTGPKE